MVFEYDAIVIGGGHSGIEAGCALANLGANTLMLCMDLSSVALLACNPSIGGTAKGHLVREIDALGGQMGIVADKTLIQLRMLNRSKGSAVQSLRAQVDKNAYHSYMKSHLEKTERLSLRQSEAESLLYEQIGDKKYRILGVKTTNGLVYHAKAVVICCGVYLNSRTITGDLVEDVSASGLKNSKHLSKSLSELGFELRRFKTGTPARVAMSSIRTDRLEVQCGESDIYSFSEMTKKTAFDRTICYLGYTNSKTHEIINQNMHRAPLYSGKIEGVGARYCPSIEDKLVRFADKERHQFFLEPEGLDTDEAYVQGLSTSLPADTQYEMYKSLEGFENVKIMRDAYAIEYDCIDSTALGADLMSKSVEGLYFAGQINGTSGYEEAGAQGLMAGINASRFIKGLEPVILGRDQAYIGVLIDDLVTKGTNEPYRMMTSRAEFRLQLRQDNADLRLTEIGYKIGLATKQRFNKLKQKKKHIERIEGLLDKQISIEQANLALKEQQLEPITKPMTLRELILRTEISASSLKKHMFIFKDALPSALEQVLISARYAGYLKRQQRQIDVFNRLEQRSLPQDIDYSTIKGLRIEAQQKLNLIKPHTLGQAIRISGINPADINVLIIYLAQKQY